MHLKSGKLCRERGQSLVETALMMPLLIILVLNVINFGYFFLVAVNLAGAARTAALYAVEGSATPISTSGLGLPSSGGSTPTTNITTVTYLAFQDMTGAVWKPTGASVRVCSETNGVNTNTGNLVRASCETCTSSGCGAAGNGTPVPDADPEGGTNLSPAGYILHQVRISYTFNTLIPGWLFNVPLGAISQCTAAGSCTFIRQAEMRSMN